MSMRFLVAIIFIILILGLGAVFYLYPTLYGIKPDNSTTPRLSELTQSISSNPSQPESEQTNTPVETIVAQGLDTPWAIAFLPARSASSTADAGGPDGDMLVTERKGTVRLVGKNGSLQADPVATLPNVKEIGEGGLLGLTLDPNFASNNFVYLYYTYSGEGENTLNRVVKMKYQNGKLSSEQILVDNIPGNSNHNGGRIKFGPDNYLYITTGDAQEPSRAQDKNSLAGKILRVTTEGKPAPGNPFNNEVYSYGHRNPQGIVWDGKGNLRETEHGPSGGKLGTGNDEVNLIQAGNNYGWPLIQGDQAQEGMVRPIKNSTPKVAWAPGDIAILGDTLYFSGLRGQALYRTKINGTQLTAFEELLKGKYGRIREVIVGPDGMLYITTSNRDGRGVAKSEDDRIIRINPSKL